MLMHEPQQKSYGKMIMSLHVNSICNLSCKECIMQPLMQSSIKYHMSIEELEELLYFSKLSGYRFDFIVSGGEPLLWENLKDGLKLLKDSDICKSITMFSNAMFPEKVTKEIADCLDSIRISHYFYNEKHMKQLEIMYPDKVRIEERTKFWEMPKTAVESEIAFPVICLNAGFKFYNKQVYACVHALSLVELDPSNAEIPLGNPLGLDFLEGLAEIKENQKEICRWCISNQRVRDYVEKVDNISEGKNLVSIII